MLIHRAQFELDSVPAPGSNLLLRFSRHKRPFDKILMVTDDKGNTFTHVDYGMWVALKTTGGTQVINIDAIGRNQRIEIEVVETAE